MRGRLRRWARWLLVGTGRCSHPGCACPGTFAERDGGSGRVCLLHIDGVAS